MFMYCNGLMVLLGETIGIGNWNNIRRLPVITLQIVLGIFSVMALPGWLLRERVIGFITDLPDVSAQAVSIFWLVILTEASRPFYEIAKYSLQTIGGERKALILTGMINSVALVAIWVLPNQLPVILSLVMASNLICAGSFYFAFRKACDGEMNGIRLPQ